MQINQNTANLFISTYREKSQLLGDGIIDTRNGAIDFCPVDSLAQAGMQALRRLVRYAQSVNGFVVINERDRVVIAHERNLGGKY